MTCFAINYQLNNAKNYDPLWAELERLNGHKVLRSLYFLELNLERCTEVRDHFAQFIDNDDAVVVIKLESAPAHRMGFQGTNAWIASHFS